MGVARRQMTKADLDAVIELEHAAFAEEAWTRQMLIGELDQQPASTYFSGSGLPIPKKGSRSTASTSSRMRRAVRRSVSTQCRRS